MPAVMFPKFCNSDASWDFLVSCALLTTKVRQGRGLMISLLTTLIQMVCICIRIRHLPYKPRLAILICIAISFTKAQGKVIRRLSIVSFQPHCVVTCTYSAEVCFSLCLSVASRHCFVSRSALLSGERSEREDCCQKKMRYHTIQRQSRNVIYHDHQTQTYLWKQTKSPEH